MAIHSEKQVGIDSSPHPVLQLVAIRQWRQSLCQTPEEHLEELCTGVKVNNKHWNRESNPEIRYVVNTLKKNTIFPSFLSLQIEELCTLCVCMYCVLFWIRTQQKHAYRACRGMQGMQSY